MLNRSGLNRGNPGNKGGGRPHDWLKEKCQGIVEKKRLIEFLANVASGDPFVEKITIKGETIEKTKESAEVRDRLKAVEMLKDWGFGKAPQELQHSGSISAETVDQKIEREARVKTFLKVA